MTMWKRHLNRRLAAPVVSAEQSDPTILNRIEALLKNPMINNWERTFLPSILEQFKKKGSLSIGQLQTFKGVEQRNSPEVQLARSQWEAAWDEKKAQEWDTMIGYYRSTGYFRNAVEAYGKNPKRIPSESEYRKICQNVYAKRYQKNLEIPPKFTVGSLAVLRPPYAGSKHALVMIVEVGNVLSAVKGSRAYTVYVVGADETGMSNSTVTEERFLLYYRPSMDKKLAAKKTDQ